MIKKGETTTKKVIRLSGSVDEFFIDKYNTVHTSVKKSIAQCEQLIKSYEQDSKYYQQESKSKGQLAIDESVNLKRLKKEFASGGEEKRLKELFKNQFSNLANNKFIKSINFYKDFENETKRSGFYSLRNTLVIQTRNLDYTGHFHNFSLGSFIIFITFNTSGEDLVKVYNTTYKDGDYQHVCVKRGNICWGTMGTESKKALKAVDIDKYLFLLINFLRKPNYDAPFRGEDDHKKNRRKVKIKPTHETEFSVENFRKAC